MKEKKYFDTFLFLPFLILMGYGVIMVFSASIPTAALDPSCHYDPFFFLKRHLMWLALGTVALLVGFYVDLKVWRKYAQLLILFAIILLIVLIAVPSLSREILGARRTFVLGPISFQPSEFAKIALIIYTADALARRKEKVAKLGNIFTPLMVFGIVVYLIDKQPDLGTIIAISGTIMGMFFMAGANFFHLLGIGLLGGAVVVVKIMGETYRRQRILAFLDPWKYQDSLGYQITQSFIALGSGGIYGLGLGQSRQKFFYLPEKFTDFIFSVIGEELGLLFGTLPIIILFVIILYKGLRLSVNVKDDFMSFLAGGITFQIVLQAFINMAVVSGVLPCTGIPLPFISFGGSSLVFSMFSLGLLLNVSSMKDKLKRKRLYEKFSSQA